MDTHLKLMFQEINEVNIMVGLVKKLLGRGEPKYRLKTTEGKSREYELTIVEYERLIDLLYGLITLLGRLGNLHELKYNPSTGISFYDRIALPEIKKLYFMYTRDEEIKKFTDFIVVDTENNSMKPAEKVGREPTKHYFRINRVSYHSDLEELSLSKKTKK